MIKPTLKNSERCELFHGGFKDRLVAKNSSLPGRSWFFATTLLLCALALSMPAQGDLFAQSAITTSKDEESTDGKKAASPAPQFDEEVILNYLNATRGSIDDDGRIHLVYNFKTKENTLLADWSPKLSKAKRAIRWSRGYEGTWKTIEDGLIIADKGTFVHRARWDGDVEMSVDYLSVSIAGKRDLLAAVYAYDRGKRIIGSQVGEQCVRIRKNLSLLGRPIPEAPLSQIDCEKRIQFGMRLEDGVFSATNYGRETASSRDNERFLKKVTPGHVGLAWNGRINGFILSITLKGRLDPEWVAKNIPGGLIESAP